jgi:hypothetical protein
MKNSREAKIIPRLPRNAAAGPRPPRAVRPR